MPQSLLTGQLQEKPTYRVWCLYSSFVHDPDSIYARRFQALQKRDSNRTKSAKSIYKIGHK